MRIWIDADACPREISELLLRTSQRRQISVVRIANRRIAAHPSSLIEAVRVDGGFDAADRYIAEHVASGDLVITADVPLAAAIVERGALGLSPRGEIFDAGNVGDKRAMRDLMAGLRATGVVEGGPAAPTPTDRRRFADALDRLLTRLARARATKGSSPPPA